MAVDESGFYVLPAVVRTYAPRGQTPVLRSPYTRDHLSAISAITPDGRLVVHEQREAIRGPDVAAFLRQLLRRLPGKLLALWGCWDGASIHRNQDVRDFLAAGAAQRLHLEHFPAYAPEANPDEGIWRYLKRVELRNRCCQDVEELRWEFHLAVRRLRRKPDIIRACFRQCGFTV